jgi:hypothetical protein
VKVTIQVSGADSAGRHMRDLGDRLLDARPVFLDIVKSTILPAERRRFDSSGFGRWPRLDPDTIRRKSRRGQPQRILEATGTLKRALTVLGASGQRLAIRPNELRFGLTPNGAAYYGRFHQLGKGNPKRVVIGVQNHDRAVISQRVRGFIVKGA